MKHSYMRQVLVLALCVMLLVVGVGAMQSAAAPAGMLDTEPGIAPGWQVYHTEAPPTFSSMSPHSLRLDSGGYPRAAYGGDHLYFFHKEGDYYYTDTVDAAWNVGKGAALALDSAGKAHISYYDATNRDLKYATNKSGSWQVETVVSYQDVGSYSDIAIDSVGDPAIVYYDATNRQLRHIWFDSEYGAWGPDQQVATGLYDPGHTGWFSFAFDTSVIPNKSHISYYGESSSGNGALYYSTYANGWTQTTLDSCSAPCHPGEYNALALDPITKRPSVAYYFDGLTDPTVIYRIFNGTNWYTYEYIESGYAKNISLAIDVTSKAHVAYQDDGFRYLQQEGTISEWYPTVKVDSSTTAGEWSSMAVVGTTAKVTHYDTQTGQLKFIDHTRSGWLPAFSYAVQGNDVGKCASLAVDKLGRAHKSYYDDTADKLVYTSENIANGWNPLYDITGSTGASCFSIITTHPTSNAPFVGMIKNGSLYYNTVSAGAWQANPTLVASGISALSTGYHAFGMALRSDGSPAFAYFKDASLYYAYWNGSAWSETHVANNTNWNHVSLAIDSTNGPHVLFHQNNDLTHGFIDNVVWKFETIDPAVQYYGTAISVSPSGQVGAAFLSSGGWHMNYASRTSSCNASHICAWTAPVMVDSECEEEFSLVLDQNSSPHIACWALEVGGGEALHYIIRRGSTWTIQVVDTNSLTGDYPAIALSQVGNPLISYYDISNRDSKFALIEDQNLFLPTIWK